MNKNNDSTLEDHEILSQSNELGSSVICDDKLVVCTKDSGTEDLLGQESVLAVNTIEESIPLHHVNKSLTNTALMEPVIEVINIPNETSQEYVPIEFINDKDLSDTIMNAEITYAVDVLDQVGKSTSEFCIQKGLLI